MSKEKDAVISFQEVNNFCKKNNMDIKNIKVMGIMAKYTKENISQVIQELDKKIVKKC